MKVTGGAFAGWGRSARGLAASRPRRAAPLRGQIALNGDEFGGRAPDFVRACRALRCPALTV
jgi:hypothetical protein